MEDCFIICPIGGDDTDTRQRSDKMMKHVFKPVLENNNYTAIRADQISKVGMITTQIINLILECPLVIADLTDSNPNVFYELAIRHATRKPYIQIIEKGQKIPFDLNSIRTIIVDIQDLDSVEHAKSEIEKQIEEFQKGHIPDSPISVASSTKILQSNEDLAEEIADRISNFTTYVEYPKYGYDIDEKVESIYRKLWAFDEYSTMNPDKLDRKLNDIIKILEKLKNDN